MKETIDDFLGIGIKTVRTVGNTLVECQKKGLKVERKEGGSFVTEAERTAENRAADIILAEYPEHGFRGEEFGERNGGSQKHYWWAIDPCDGSNGFKNHEATASVSLSLFRDSTPILGVILNPFTNELYTAAEGRKSKLNSKKLPIVDQKGLDTINYKLPKSGVRDLNTLAVLELDEQVDRIVSQRGGPSYALALVAKGSHSGFVMDCYRDAKPEDYSAGVLLVRNAGGLVTNLEGMDINPLTQRGYMIASSNPKVHEQLLKVLNDYGFGTKRPSGKIIYIGGFYGTGKSTIAMKLEEGLGYKRFNSDITRREFEMQNYDIKDADWVWGTIFWKAGVLLHQGKGVIMESTYLNEEQRLTDFDLGRSKHAEGMFIEVVVPEQVAKERMKSRPVSPDGVHVPTNGPRDYDKVKDIWTPLVPDLMSSDTYFVSYMIFNNHTGTLHEGWIRKQHRQWAKDIADCLGVPLIPMDSNLVNCLKRYEL